jgi:ribose transport system ATP-binding protein
MVGRDISQFYARRPHEAGDVLLEVKDLVTPAHPEHKLNFAIRAGEIVGISGLVGAGRTEMLQVLFGVEPALGGQIHLDGEVKNFASPIDAINGGIALVPENRKEEGLVLGMSVLQNISLPGLRRHRKFGAFRNGGQEVADTGLMIDQMNIKTPSGDQIVQYLSGGNQQKVVIGKWLAMHPRVLLLDEPTRGIDVGAKQEIYILMEELAEKGVAVLFVSSELEEIIGMSDRALVMHEGRITGELQRDELSEEAIMHLATGGSSAA